MGASKSKQQQQQQQQQQKQQQQQQEQHRLENTTSKDRAMLELKNARDKIKKYRKKSDEEILKLNILAKKLMKENKQQSAKLALKRKIMKEKLILKAENEYFLIVKMIDNVEWESVNVQVFEALQTGNRILEQLRQEMPIDKIEEILDGLNESSDKNEEINLIIIGNNNLLEDEELLKELDNLMEQDQIKTINDNSNVKKTDITDSLPEIPRHPILPLVPTAPIVIDSGVEERQAMLS